MRITVHQAICGEKDKGFALLKTTMTDLAQASKIAFKADLQETIPAGIVLQPVIRGFLFGEHFLFIKTFPDPSPDVRNGRVFSHCLIVSKDDLKHLTDLSHLSTFFLTKVDKEVTFSAIELDATIKGKPLPENLKERFNKAIRGYIGFQENGRTIIWVNQESFEPALFRFWQLLQLSEKFELNFGINFNPSEVPKNKINFLTTASSSESKFSNSGFCVIGTTDRVELTEFSEQYLAGDPGATDRLQAFREAIGARVVTLQEIGTMAKGIPTLENLETTRDFKLVNTLSHIVAAFSPDSKNGKAFKDSLIKKVCDLSASATTTEVSILKNFKTASFANSEDALSTALKKWVSSNVLNQTVNKREDFAPFIISVITEHSTKQNWWNKSISGSIKAFLLQATNEMASLVWQWVVKDPHILETLTKYIERSDTCEEHFIVSLPKVIPQAALDLIKRFAIKLEWLRLFAHLLRRGKSLEKSIIELEGIDGGKSKAAAYEIVLEGTQPADIIDLTIQHPTAHLIAVGGGLCNKSPYLLSQMDVTNPVWQDMWIAAIRHGNKFTDGVSNPQKIVHEIFDQLINGKTVRPFLVEKVAGSEFNSILKYAQRQKLWDKLPAQASSKIITGTITEVYQSVNGKGLPANVNDIKAVLLRGNNLDLVLKELSPSVSIWLFKSLRELTESKFIDLLNMKVQSFSSADCKEIGLLINERKSESVFNLINSRLVQRNSNFNITIDLTADTFSKHLPLDFFGLLGSHAPRKNHNPERKTKVVFLSANPVATDRLRVDKELHEIENALQASSHRDKFDLISKGAVKYDTFSQALLENVPEIVHFSGHANRNGIVLEDKDGEAHVVPNEALDRLFSQFKGKIKTVILNACYSESQALTISKYDIYVVGMNDQINDQVALNFSLAFYFAVWAGHDSKVAFNTAIASLLANNRSSAGIPVLWYKGKQVVNAKGKKDK